MLKVERKQNGDATIWMTLFNATMAGAISPSGDEIVRRKVNVLQNTRHSPFVIGRDGGFSTDSRGDDLISS